MLLSVFTHTKTNTLEKTKLPSLMISAVTLLSLINPQIASAKKPNNTTINCNTQTNFSPCFYVAGGLIGSKVSPKGSIGGWSTSSSSSTGYNLVIGSQIKPHWFGELAYSNLGKAKLKNSSSAITGTESISYSIPSLHVGYLVKPVSETTNYFAKGGISFIQNSASSDTVPYKKQNSVLPSFSAGVQWQSPQNGLFARLSGDYHSSDAMGVNILIGFKFNASDKNTSGRANQYTRPKTVTKRRPTITKHRARPTKRRAPARRIANNAPPQLLHIISNIVKQPPFAGVLNGVDFNPRTAILTPRAKGVLNGIARKLKQKPNMRVAIIGHTDSLGITAENKLLSRTRASAVKSYLIKQGINARRMVAEGRGDSQPRATNSTEGGRRANRRIELRAL